MSSLPNGITRYCACVTNDAAATSRATLAAGLTRTSVDSASDLRGPRQCIDEAASGVALCTVSDRMPHDQSRANASSYLEASSVARHETSMLIRTSRTRGPKSP